MKKRKIARFGYLLISALFCCTAFAIWLWPDYSPQAACCVSGTILLGYGVIRILGFFSDDSYCPAFHYDLACGLLFMVVGTVIWIKGVRSYPYLIPGLGWIALLDSLCKIQMSKEARDFGLHQRLTILHIYMFRKRENVCMRLWNHWNIKVYRVEVLLLIA